MSQTFKLDRRAFLKGTAGMTLALPVLEAMGKDVVEKTPRRFCALYTANGMSLPHAKHGIDEWSWFLRAEQDGEFVFGKSTEAFAPFRQQLSFMGGLYHPNGPEVRSARVFGHVAHRRTVAGPQTRGVQQRGTRPGGG